MSHNRRQFIYKSLAGIVSMLFSPRLFGYTNIITNYTSHSSKPWIELSRSAYFFNTAQISKMAGGKPVIAVLKNNAYGLGDVQISKILNDSSHIVTIAVVKDERAMAIRDGGVSKPILLMGDFDDANVYKLVEKDITLSVFSKASLDKITAQADKISKTIKVAIYIDTGLGRMGIPYQDTIHIAEEIAKNKKLLITQIFSTLTTPKDFAYEQILRFENIIKKFERKGISTGLKHLAPSYSLIDVIRSHQDAVRPGILLHGSFPVAKMEEAMHFPLQVTYRLKAPIIRIEKLRKGDTIGFSRFYKIEKDEWIATLPIGWADGYNGGAENGAMVLVRDKLYKVVNVNANHTNISLGSKTKIKVGEEVTLIGPDRAEITPEGFGNLVKGHNYLQINYKESIHKKIYETF